MAAQAISSRPGNDSERTRLASGRIVRVGLVVVHQLPAARPCGPATEWAVERLVRHASKSGGMRPPATLPPAPCRLFRRILVANRGEIALRVIRTAQEMGIETVAVYSDADRTALHVRRADRAVHLGGSKPSESYLDIGKVIAAAKATGCDALHPGYGFLSENEDLGRRPASEAGIEFLGPPPHAIRRWATRSRRARSPRRRACRWCRACRRTSTRAPLVAAAKQVGYPVMLKAAAGGGGKGIRIVREEKQLLEAFHMARAEAKGAFGDDRIYLEKFVTRPRHVEIQVMADKHGNVRQLRRARVLGAAPPPEAGRGVAVRGADPEELRAQMGKAACDLARGRLRRRRHRRVPVLGGRVLLPRDEHAPAGRAPGHRDALRGRPRARADPRRRRRRRCRRCPSRVAMRSRCASTPRTRTPTSRRSAS
jgi:hypothetical protein